MTSLGWSTKHRAASNAWAWGTYRVELLISLFGRIIDIHNLEVVLRELTAREHAAVLCRIGILNVFNPMKAANSYILDLTRWEDRQVAKILIHLHVMEPSSIWLHESHDVCDVPGKQLQYPPSDWTMPPTWGVEEGFPKTGWLTLQYTTPDGLNTGVNKPDWSLRSTLSSLVLASSNLPSPQGSKVRLTADNANETLANTSSKALFLQWSYSNNA